MLCGAMSEIAKRVGLGGGRYTSRLEGFVHGAEEASGRAQMLGGGAAAPRVGGGDGRPLIVGPVGCNGGIASCWHGVIAAGVRSLEAVVRLLAVTICLIC